MSESSESEKAKAAREAFVEAWKAWRLVTDDWRAAKQGKFYSCAERYASLLAGQSPQVTRTEEVKL